MTRKEEIIQTARQKEKEVGFTQIVKDAKVVNSAYGIGFLEGAEWADETMIEKACKYISRHQCEYIDFDEFKNYMKGETNND